MTKQPVIGADALARVGRSLFGNQWQIPLARELDISERSMRYMAAGERPVHAGIARDLLAVVKARRNHMGEIAGELAAALQRAEA